MTDPHGWLEHAACKGMDPRLFFPVKGAPWNDNGNRAKRICADCPVRQECLDDALKYGDRDGIRAGLSVKERRKQYPRAPKIAECGTDSGYYRHRSNAEDACVECKQAHADKQRTKFKVRRPTDRQLDRTAAGGRYQSL